MIGISTDVTQQRRLQAKAIQNDRVMAMGTLAASVAHEINNPLSYILGSLDEIDRAWARHDLEAVRASLKAVRAGAERIRNVTRDLRSFSRPDDERSARWSCGRWWARCWSWCARRSRPAPAWC